MLERNSKHLLYFNDAGHFNNESIWNPLRNSELTDDFLEHEVSEAAEAGFDVFIEEIYGMIPWYPSDLYSAKKHMDWFYHEFGGKDSNPFLTYTQQGNDFVRLHMDKTHEQKKLFFFSYRMNDAHGLNSGDNPDTAKIIWISRFWVEHPEYRIKQTYPDLPTSKYMLDFQYPEVRAYKLAMIRELIGNYGDMDGMMLDFLRMPAFFNLQTTTRDQREAIITDFVSEVKRMLDDKAAETGKKYYFGVVLPLIDKKYDDMGVDIDNLYQVGVRMISFWDYYYTVQGYQIIEKIKRKYPDLLVYAQVSHATSYDARENGSAATSRKRYTTAEQYYTCAYTAYEHLADGIAVFNFPYYRNWQYPAGTYIYGYEPPFDLMSRLKNMEFLKAAPQHYFIGRTENKIGYDLDLRFLTLRKGQNTFTFTMDMIPPKDGWAEDGTLRLEAERDISNTKLTICVNHKELIRTERESFSYEKVYECLIGGEEQIQKFKVPSDVLRIGENMFEVIADLGEETDLRLTYIDLIIR